MTVRIDLHSHSTVSDGLDAPAALVRRYHDAGITTLALTDHDTLAGIPEARQEAARWGMELIPGAEVSADADSGEDVHILALFVSETESALNGRLAARQRQRALRGQRMANNLVAAGYDIDLDAIRADVGDGVWGRPHLARALVAAGHAASMNEAFDRFLHEGLPWWVPSENWPAADAVATIRRAGGLAVIAHPIWNRDPEGLIRTLVSWGLDGIEVFHPDHGPAEEERFGRLARELSLAVTAGTDFHGTLEGRKRPGAITGDAAMLDALRDRLEHRR
jgi:3',5'-nucleoside bisphosphate phosphatase